METRIPAYTDGKPATCCSSQKRKEKIKVHKSSKSHWHKIIYGLSITSVKIFSQWQTSNIWSYSELCMWRCLELTELTNEKVYLKLCRGRGKECREDEFRAKKTQSTWKCLCKFFQEITIMKGSLKEVTRIYFIIEGFSWAYKTKTQPKPKV